MVEYKTRIGSVAVRSPLCGSVPCGAVFNLRLSLLYGPGFDFDFFEFNLHFHQKCLLNIDFIGKH